MNILDRLSEYAKERTASKKLICPAEVMKRQALSMPRGEFSFEKALAGRDLSFICECKKASPSKGLISPDYDPVAVAAEYEKAGADCISVLTEPKWFLGSEKDLMEVSRSVSIPCLRKDFTVDEYMIYEAAVIGASAVLLICSILEKEQMKEYISICDALGLSALVEAHDEKEIETALDVKARIIGVNNRDLKDFSVDTKNSAKLKTLVPDNVLFVSESGVKGVSDIVNIAESGADAALIGEVLMRSADKKKTLAELKAAGRRPR